MTDDPVDELAQTWSLPSDCIREIRSLISGTTHATIDSTAADEAPPPLPDFDARYEDLGPIGAGGMGEVRRVLDRHLRCRLALKILSWRLVDRPQARARFRVEAQVTARLRHPGIVSVQDQGELPDGRLWFTMTEVRGRTLTSAVRSGMSLRQRIDTLRRVCEAIAYAHSEGVIHRDLKPDNIMVGEFGEVYVMDWGLARHLSEPSEEGSGEADWNSSGTCHGDVLGTPAFMAPEQAIGALDALSERTDVYALGAILYVLLSGRPVYHGTPREIWQKVRTETPPPLRDVPAALADICATAMARDPDARYPNAAPMAAVLAEWLDGARRREQALAVLAEAAQHAPKMIALRARAATLRAEAAALLGKLQTFDPEEKKAPGWAMEDRAEVLEQEAAVLEATWIQTVRSALNLVPELPEAHALLAEHYRQRLLSAEARHALAEAARFEVMMAAHDDGRDAAFRSGVGALTLHTEPPGASVRLLRFTEQRRRLVPVPVGDLGPTPIIDHALPRGSYLLEISAPGREALRYPILIARGGHWDGVPPGASEPHAVPLLRAGSLGPADCRVPAGWFTCGGDPDAADPLPERRVWVDGFVMKRSPVTNQEYLAFLSTLSPEDLLQHAPKRPRAMTESTPTVIIDGGQATFHPEARALFGGPSHPVVLISWHSAMAFARWAAAQTGQPWRLPSELEWEKAARGVDGRFCVWGNYVEPTWAQVLGGQADPPAPVAVGTHPTDESVYGVRDLTGNVRDWCIEVWQHGGPPLREGGLLIQPADPEDSDFRVVRGGAWSSPARFGRSASRFADRPDTRYRACGFRLVRAL